MNLKISTRPLMIYNQFFSNYSKEEGRGEEEEAGSSKDPGIVAHTFDTNSWEVDAGGSQWVWGQPGLQCELQDYIVQELHSEILSLIIILLVVNKTKKEKKERKGRRRSEHS